ncbi:Fe-only nitrogenase accessory AnfO family protein [Methanoregula sp.]|uniref:Fe-only nitrogenase accessory AnfO family protein n=1 Tax=Methanoregula sp. TaxID=2052170 RepID=UPI003C717FF8
MCIQEITAIIGTDGVSIPLNEPGNVVVYRRVRGTWQKDREMAFALSPEQGLRELRRKMEELKGFLHDCRIVVAKSASGALYFELEKARCSVWEIEGTPAGFLDTVWREEKTEQDEESLSVDAGIPAPTEVFPGRFAISIREIQGKRPEVSSKQVLQEFVRKGDFEELEILCDHIPPWIAIDAEQRGYAVVAEQIRRNEVKVRLIKNAGGMCE